MLQYLTQKFLKTTQSERYYWYWTSWANVATRCPVRVLFLPPLSSVCFLAFEVLFNSKNFQDSLFHRILRHIYDILNIY